MKKFLIIGIVSLLVCSFTSNASEPTEKIDCASQITVCSSRPKTVIRGERVIIIYKDGTVVVVDKDKDNSTVVRP